MEINIQKIKIESNNSNENSTLQRMHDKVKETCHAMPRAEVSATSHPDQSQRFQRCIVMFNIIFVIYLLYVKQINFMDNSDSI